MSRAYFLIFFSIYSTLSIADPQITRREVLKSFSACVVSSIALRSSAAYPSHHRWALHPEADIETLGLESFGESVQEIMEKEGPISDQTISDRIRWSLQEKVWKRIEPKSELSGPTQITVPVAIWIKRDTYLYFSPSFRIIPIPKGSPLDGKRTLARVEYVSDMSDPRILTYGLGGPPRGTEIVLGADVRKGKLRTTSGIVGP